jgi:uncharacterized damage-inducible protein DinB
MPNPEIEILLAMIDQAFDRRSWHGTNLKGSIKGMTAGEAAWRPGPGRHNVWEIVVHAAYWKYAVRRRLTGEARGSFPVKGSNWIERPGEAGADGGDAEAAWRADVRLLTDTHRTLREAVARLAPAEIRATPRGSKVSNLAIVTGIAAHDLYHAGQIQVLKRLRPS